MATAVASAVVWTAVVQLTSITGLFYSWVLEDCGGGRGGGGAAVGLATLTSKDSVAVRLLSSVFVPKSECFYSLLAFLLSGDLGEVGTV
jgi:rhamnogalacturonan I rhamnosyltransferase